MDVAPVLLEVEEELVVEVEELVVVEAVGFWWRPMLEELGVLQELKVRWWAVVVLRSGTEVRLLLRKRLRGNL